MHFLLQQLPIQQGVDCIYIWFAALTRCWHASHKGICLFLQINPRNSCHIAQILQSLVSVSSSFVALLFGFHLRAALRRITSGCRSRGPGLLSCRLDSASLRLRHRDTSHLWRQSSLRQPIGKHEHLPLLFRRGKRNFGTHVHLLL